MLANFNFNSVYKPAAVIPSVIHSDETKTEPDVATSRYDELLCKGDDIFKFAMENISGTYSSTDQQFNFTNNVKANELRWFLLPNEVNFELFTDKLKIPFTPRLYATRLTPADYHVQHYSTIPVESSLTRLSTVKFNSKLELSIPKKRKCFPGTS